MRLLNITFVYLEQVVTFFKSCMAQLFQAKNETHSLGIDDAIILARTHKYEEIDLTKYKGPLTEQQIDQILSLPGLQKIKGNIDLKALFPKLNIIDDAVWRERGLEVDIAIDIRSAIYNLYEMYRLLKIEGNAGITLLKLPEGLTLNKLIVIAKQPLEGNSKSCRYIWNQILVNYGDVPLEKTYTVAVTNSILEKSRNLSRTDQQELVQRNGCDIPDLLEMLALTLMAYVSSSEMNRKRLYSDNPRTYSRVSEILYGFNLVVGDFSRCGICISNHNGDDISVGVAGVRRF